MSTQIITVDKKTVIKYFSIIFISISAIYRIWANY